MKRGLSAALAAVLGLLTAGPIAVQGAAFTSGNQLVEECSGQDDFPSGVCAGYVMGVADLMMSDGTVGGLAACLPPSVIPQQLMDVVTTYLAAHPEKRQYSAVGLVAAAFSVAFPC